MSAPEMSIKFASKRQQDPSADDFDEVADPAPLSAVPDDPEPVQEAKAEPGEPGLSEASPQAASDENHAIEVLTDRIEQLEYAVGHVAQGFSDEVEIVASFAEALARITERLDSLPGEIGGQVPADTTSAALEGLHKDMVAGHRRLLEQVDMLTTRPAPTQDMAPLREALNDAIASHADTVSADLQQVRERIDALSTPVETDAEPAEGDDKILRATQAYRYLIQRNERLNEETLARLSRLDPLLVAAREKLLGDQETVREISDKTRFLEQSLSDLHAKIDALGTAPAHTDDETGHSESADPAVRPDIENIDEAEVDFGPDAPVSENPEGPLAAEPDQTAPEHTTSPPELPLQESDVADDTSDVLAHSEPGSLAAPDENQPEEMMSTDLPEGDDEEAGLIVDATDGPPTFPEASVGGAVTETPENAQVISEIEATGDADTASLENLHSDDSLEDDALRPLEHADASEVPEFEAEAQTFEESTGDLVPEGSETPALNSTAEVQNFASDADNSEWVPDESDVTFEDVGEQPQETDFSEGPSDPDLSLQGSDPEPASEPAPLHERVRTSRIFVAAATKLGLEEGTPLRDAEIADEGTSDAVQMPSEDNGGTTDADETCPSEPEGGETVESTNILMEVPAPETDFAELDDQTTPDDTDSTSEETLEAAPETAFSGTDENDEPTHPDLGALDQQNPQENNFLADELGGDPTPAIENSDNPAVLPGDEDSDAEQAVQDIEEVDASTAYTPKDTQNMMVESNDIAQVATESDAPPEMSQQSPEDRGIELEDLDPEDVALIKSFMTMIKQFRDEKTAKASVKN